MNANELNYTRGSISAFDFTRVEDSQFLGTSSTPALPQVSREKIQAMLKIASVLARRTLSIKMDFYLPLRRGGDQTK